MKSLSKFGMCLEANYFNKGDVVIFENNRRGIVTWVHDKVWWRKLLRWLGFKIKYTYTITIKPKK